MSDPPPPSDDATTTPPRATWHAFRREFTGAMTTLPALGREALTAMAAHAMNNPLGYVLMNLELIDEEVRQSARTGARLDLDSLRGSLDDALAGTMALKRLIEVLRALGGVPPLDVGPVRVDDVYRAVLGGLVDDARPLVAHDPDDDARVVVDQGLLTAALVAFVDDALALAPDADERARVTLGVASVDDRRLALMLRVRRVTTGAAFDPFVQRAPRPPHAGDGLVHGVLRVVARVHHGELRVTAELDEEVVLLVLPRG